MISIVLLKILNDYGFLSAMFFYNIVEIFERGFVGVVAVDEGKVKFLSIQGIAVEKMVEVVVYETDIADFSLGKFVFCKFVGFGTAFNGS